MSLTNKSTLRLKPIAASVKPSITALPVIPSGTAPPSALVAPAIVEKQFSPNPQYAKLLEQVPALLEYLPLVIGVSERLLAKAVAGEIALTPRELSQAMFIHCTTKKYLRTLAIDGAFRHDLDGNPVVPVSDEHRQYACQVLLYREAKAKVKANK